MWYWVSGRVTGEKICDCEYCPGHKDERILEKTVIMADSPEHAINVAIADVAARCSWENWEWDQKLEVADLPPDQVMLRIGAQPLFDLSAL